MASRRSEKVPRTTIAKLYGYYAHPPLEGIIPLKSGLTPVTSNPQHTVEERRFVDNVRWLQRRSNANFTSAELECLDALAPLYQAFQEDIAVDDRADIAIHPVMRREKWNPPIPKHLAEFPMGEQRDGYWNAYTNDAVWEALLPSIRMASLYLSNADMWPWFDALFAAEWTDVPANEVPKDSMEKDYKRFFARDFTKYGSEEGRKIVRDKILEYSKHIFFRVTSSYVDAANGVEQHLVEDETTGASTVTNLALDISVVQIALERIEPLLPGNVEKLNVAERAQMEVDATITIIHELAHALYHRDYVVSFPEYGPKELYFQQEVISELGHSVSLRLGIGYGMLICLRSFVAGAGYIWRGQAESSSGEGRRCSLFSAGCGTIFVSNTPNNSCFLRLIEGSTMHSAYAMHMSNAIHPILLNKPPNFQNVKLWPIPIPWYLNMGSKGRFQVFVKKYGAQTLQYTKVVGTEYRVNKSGERPPEKRLPWVEFKGIPRNKRHPGLGMDRLEGSQPLHRRRRVQNIAMKARVFRRPSPSLEVRAQAESLYKSIEPGDHDLPSCPRFDEISTYLIDNRRQLALHTMCFLMPEHLLRDYILRLGGLAISAQEWRAYLLNCEAMPYLFRFKPEGRKWGETSTYRGSIQLHASSWPKTDLTPLKPQRNNAEIGNVTDFILTLNQLRMLRNSTKSSDPMWLLPVFWDFSAEDFLAAYNADVKKGGVATSSRRMTLMSAKQLEDIVWHLASTSSFLTWAPNGIIRRLPLTDPEYQELLRELCTIDDLVFPKGRHLIDWDGDHESLVKWDNLKMETDYEVLLEQNGIHYVNGESYTYDEYFDAEEMEEIRGEMEQEEGEKESMVYMLKVNDYVEKHPGVGAQETFKQAFWPTWSAKNPDGKEEDALEEFMGGFWDDADVQVKPLDLSELSDLVDLDACPNQ
ncbi:hypothetical protein MFRU_002g04990 [Monilinia fructicola]|nr:hypothetical protein MFRU_002g04990 [Monilinia fructicola]